MSDQDLGPPLSLTVALVLGAAGCTGDSDGDDPSDEPDPQDAATALASGLTAKDLSKVAFTADTATTAQASYDRITQEMDAAKLQVDTAGVEQTGPPRWRRCTGRGTSPRRRGSTTPRPS